MMIFLLALQAHTSGTYFRHILQAHTSGTYFRHILQAHTSGTYFSSTVRTFWLDNLVFINHLSVIFVFLFGTDYVSPFIFMILDKDKDITAVNT